VQPKSLILNINLYSFGSKLNTAIFVGITALEWFEVSKPIPHIWKVRKLRFREVRRPAQGGSQLLVSQEPFPSCYTHLSFLHFSVPLRLEKNAYVFKTV
jgi:hypothetical protein